MDIGRLKRLSQIIDFQEVGLLDVGTLTGEECDIFHMMGVSRGLRLINNGTRATG